MLWLAVGVLALCTAAGVWLLRYVCARRPVPDAWDESELARRPAAWAGALRQGRDWLAGRVTQDVWTQSDDGLTLHALLVPRQKARGTVLLFHGYRSSWKADFGAIAPFLYAQRFQLLLVDERAHGQSGGRWISYGVLERYDVRAWAGFAADRLGERHPLFLMGLSMGATAVLMASELELPGNVRGMIADCGFTSPREILELAARRKTRLPARWVVAALNVFTTLFAGFGLSERDAARCVQETDYPLLLIHGTADSLVPCEMGRRLYEECASEKELVLVEGAGHGQSYVAGRETVEDAVRRFLEKWLNIYSL